MWQYVAIGVAVILGVAGHDLSLLPKNDSDRLKRMWIIWFWAIIISLIAVAGLRYRIGIDTVSFQYVYSNAPGLDSFQDADTSRFNGGRHILFYSLLKEIGVNAWIVQLGCAIILNGLFGVIVLRYTRNIFIALGLYLVFAFVGLNFETMYAGAVAAMLLWGLPDIASKRYGKFYLKLCAGAVFHLAALIMFWLPLLNVKAIRKFVVPGWRFVILIVVSPFLAVFAKWILLNHVGWLDNIKLFQQFNITSDIIIDYGLEILSGKALNWKGLIGIVTLYGAVPMIVGMLLWRRRKGEQVNQFLGIEMSLMFALFSIMAIIVQAFDRIAYLIILPVIISGACTFKESFSRRVKLQWTACVAIICILQLNTLRAPVADVANSYRMELYVPYASWIEKGVNYRREWLYSKNAWILGKMHNRIYTSDGRLGVADFPLYDFTFSLREGEVEIPSLIFPEIDHASMERLRQQIQKNDSIAIVKPMLL